MKICHRKTVPLLAFTWLIFTITRSNAQNIHRAISISLPAGHIRLDSLSEQLRLQSGYILSFNAGSILPASRIKLSNSLIHLDDLLEYLKRKYHFSYILLGNHIILNRLPEHRSETRATFPSGHDSHAEENVVPRRQLKDRTATDSTVLKRLEEDGGSNKPPLLQMRLLPAKGQFTVLGSPSVPTFTVPPPSFTMDTDTSYPDETIRAGGNKLFFSGGLTMDESFYISPSVKFGFPFLYLTGLWRTNFTISGFGYGIGSSYRFSQKWSVQIGVNRGTLKNTFSLYYGRAGSSPTPGDSTFVIKIKGTLLRGELFAVNGINNRLSLQFGPVFNLLNYKIFADGKPVSEVPSFPSYIDVNKKYRLLDPPYLITNTYRPERSSGRKVWIGLQVGLFYRF